VNPPRDTSAARHDRPVTDVAYDAGFQDLSNFIRAFRRETGASPRAHRMRTRAH
jgi:AraC-like DNA-binding protein